MDIALLILGGLLIMLGMAGSFLPIIPGPLTSWFGLLSLHYTTKVEQDWHFLGWTLAVALIVMALDYFIPIWGTKAFGGTKAGAIGATVGLVVGKTALKAALGSFLGFLSGVLLKFIVSFIYLLFFASTAWKAFDSWF